MAHLKSLIALSMHKAGSSIANRILQDFAVCRGYELDVIAGRVSASPLPEATFYEDYQAHMVPHGVYYGVARGPYVQNMPIIGQLRTIVQVRDPRDCITSLFFSLRESHVPPQDPEKLAKFLENREAMAAVEIDRFARGQATGYHERMQILGRIIDAHDDALVLHYEEMVQDTERWLARIAAFLEQPVTGELRARLGDKIDFTVAREDAASHKRQVAPGDHRRKLSPDTIAAMNDTLRADLRRFGYAE